MVELGNYRYEKEQLISSLLEEKNCDELCIINQSNPNHDIFIIEDSLAEELEDSTTKGKKDQYNCIGKNLVIDNS